MHMRCPDLRQGNCNRDENRISCRIHTDSGSCDNCGTMCPGATAESFYQCCLSFEIPPTRHPEFIEIKPGSCEYSRIVNQWVLKYM